MMIVDFTKVLKKIVPEPDGENVTRMRRATVTTVNDDGTLDVTMSSATLKVAALANTYFQAGQSVYLISYLGMLIALGEVATSGSNTYATDLQTFEQNARIINVVGVDTETTTSSAFSNLANASVNWTKVRDATHTRTHVRMSASFQAVTNNALAEFGVMINNTDYPLTSTAPGADLFGYPSGETYITDIPAGALNVQGRWRRALGAGTCQRDHNTWLSIAVKEVPLLS
jgi:hypothetical protein